MTTIHSLLRRYYVLAGFLSIIVAWTCIIMAIVVSGCFDWRANALSDLGDWETACSGDIKCLSKCNRASEPIFNYGLIASGILMTICSLGLLAETRTYPPLLLGASISLTLIGVFPERYSPHHWIVSFSFFILVTLAILAHTITVWRTNKKQAIASLTLFTIAIAGILLYIHRKTLGIGIAVSETVIALAGAIWLMDILIKLKKNIKNYLEISLR